MDSIMKVDTNALLTCIHDIEMRLSEHSRHDRIPPWVCYWFHYFLDYYYPYTIATILNPCLQASGFLSRLELIQQDVVDIRRSMPSNTPASVDISSNSVDVHTLASDDRIITKLRFEVDSQISSARISLDSQIASMHLEVDRLHKLLQIRPTTSEMQQVSLSVHDMNKKMQLFLDDVSASVQTAVQERVVEEMAAIMAHVKNREAINDECIANLTGKMDRSNKDLSAMRQAVEAGLEAIQSTIDRVESEVNSANQEIGALKESAEAEAARVDQTFEEVRYQQQMATDDFMEFRGEMAKDLLRIDEALDSHSMKIEDLKSDLEEKIQLSLSRVDEVKSNLDDFKSQYESDMQVAAETTQKIIQDMEALNLRFTDTERYVGVLKDMDAAKLITSQGEEIKVNEKGIENCMELISKGEKRTDSLVLQTKATDKNVEHLTLNLKEQTDKLDKLGIESEDSVNRIHQLEMALKSTQDKVDNLLALRDEVAIITELSTAADSRIKSIQTSVNAILETADDHDARIENLTMAIEQTEEESHKRLELMRSNLVETLTEKQAEMDASVQSMRDNLDVMATAGDGSGPRKPQQKLGAVFRPGGSTDGHTGSTGAPSGLPEMMSGISMSDEEQRAVAASNAKFIADLCTNFEEIAVRKTYVPEIPPTMCEHVTATCQSLTSLIATCTDAEAVQKVLRSSPGQEADYDEDPISVRRQTRLDDFLKEVSSIVVSNHPQPGMVRMDARERFVKQVRKGLTMCMSKHDQVSHLSFLSMATIRVALIIMVMCCRFSLWAALD